MKDNEFFPVIRLHRGDLIGYGWTEKQAMKLTDEQMEDLASQIADGIMESGAYWDSIENLNS